MRIRWRLQETMTARGLKSAKELHRRLTQTRGESDGLSQAQVYRLVSGPDLLNLKTLDSLCATLETTPAELLTDDLAGVPTDVLRTLLAGMAASAAHFNLCAGTSLDMQSHPGAGFAKVIAWLWRSHRRERAAELVADFLAEMRQHNPHSPDSGSRLTLPQFLLGLSFAVDTPGQMTVEQFSEMSTYLEREVPLYYGLSAAELSTP